MKFSFRKLPLTYKLLTAGIIPLLVLLYASEQLYSEKENRVTLVLNYSNHIHEAGEIGSLISELEREARYSFDFALKKGRYSNLVIQRSRTDKFRIDLEKSEDPSIKNFSKYTFLNGLEAIRAAQDSSAIADVHRTSEFFNNTILRLSTINTVALSNNTVLQPLYADVESQRLLFEITTLLSTTRTKIYLSLFTGYNMQGALSATHDAYNTLKTYEAEFLLKASPSSIDLYHAEENNNKLKPVFVYLDYASINQQFDSTYTPSQWWNMSSGGINVLNNQYNILWRQVQAGLKNIYHREIRARNLTLLFLIAAILLVVGFIVYTVRAVNKVLHELAAASMNGQNVETGKSINHAAINRPDDAVALSHKAEKTDPGRFNGIDSKMNGHAVHEKDPVGAEFKLQDENDLLAKTTRELTDDKPKPVFTRNEHLYMPVGMQHSKEDFSKVVADDMANYTEFPKPDREGEKETVGSKTEQGTDSLTSQMNELIDASEIEHSRLIYNKHTFQLNDLVSEMVNKTQHATKSHKIFLRKNAPVEVNGDRARIAQVINNLLQNAIRHCPGCESIIVSLEERNQIAVCSVEDFGDGIVISQQEKIFEKFYRVNNTKTEVHPGLGLGLFIAREIIKNHNGKIWIKSEPGLGSTFYFSLPAKQV
jgi:Histidine kinase-, DNA gyrase B-, and HSP90-like ATPase